MVFCCDGGGPRTAILLFRCVFLLYICCATDGADHGKLLCPGYNFHMFLLQKKLTASFTNGCGGNRFLFQRMGPETVATVRGPKNCDFILPVYFSVNFFVQRMGPTMVNCYVRGIVFLCFCCNKGSAASLANRSGGNRFIVLVCSIVFLFCLCCFVACCLFCLFCVVCFCLRFRL